MNTRKLFGWEIKRGELAMIHSGGGIICFCGVDLIFEGAEVDSFSVYTDPGAPSLHILCEVHALVF